MMSWKTTLSGALTSMGIALIGACHLDYLDWLSLGQRHALTFAGFICCVLGTFCHGLFARDNDKTSEDVCAPSADWKPGTVSKAVNLAILVAALGFAWQGQCAERWSDYPNTNSVPKGAEFAFALPHQTNMTVNAENLVASLPLADPWTIYSGTNWGNLNDFIQVGTVAAYLTNNGQIYLPQAPAGFGNYLIVKGTSNALDNFTMEIIYNLESNGGYALPVGESTVNPWWPKILSAYYAPTDSHLHFVAGEVTPTDNRSYSAPTPGTDITLRLTVDGLNYTVTAYWAGGVPITYTYRDGGAVASATALPSSGAFTVWNATTSKGAFLKSVRIWSHANRFPDFLCLGDSKTRGIGSGGRRFADQLPNAVVFAGQGDRTVELIQDLAFLTNYFHPKRVLLCIGRNDIASGLNYSNTYPTIVSSFSCPVYHLLPPGEPAIDQTLLDSYLRVNYPTNFIDTSSTNVSADNVHPSPSKNNSMAQTIRQRTGLQPLAEQYTPYDQVTVASLAVTNGLLTAKRTVFSGLFASQHTPSGVTNITTLTTNFSVIIPGGSIGSNGTLRVSSRLSNTAGTNVTYIVKLSGTTIHSTTSIAGGNRSFLIGAAQNRNSQAAQLLDSYGGSTFYFSGSALTTSAIDTSADCRLDATLQCTGSNQTVTLESIDVEIFGKD